MEAYTDISYRLSQQLTDAYSTSFGWSIRLIPRTQRRHVYALYGLVRLADEIVDSYDGTDKRAILDQCETDTYHALETGYSTNPLIHAFATTARAHTISPSLVRPFFHSMRLDITRQTHTKQSYAEYIDGSAEVIGLMMLRVFSDDATYISLTAAARRLGAAYQKINFLRDVAADHELGRWYFPTGDFVRFNNAQRNLIVKDITADLAAGQKGIPQLPPALRRAVYLSFLYYSRLLRKLAVTDASTLKRQRIRISNGYKLWLLVTLSFRRVQ